MKPTHNLSPLYGLVGFHLAHSFSRTYFSNKFAEKGSNEKYWNFELSHPSSIKALPSLFPSLVGFNITVPYKESVIPYIDSLSEEAEKIGAVNTVKILRSSDGSSSLRGFNTDCIGFESTVTLNPNQIAIILGTGGAAKAVAEAIKKKGATPIMVSRTPHPGYSIGYNDLSKKIISSASLIVNATPLGMWPNINDAPPFPYEYLHKNHLCYDLTYNPSVTQFMRLSSQHGASIKNGLDMLHNQAEAAYSIWTSN